MDAKYLIGAVVLMCHVTTCLTTPPKYKDCGSQKGKVLSVDISSECTASICYLDKGKNVTFKVKFVPNEVVNASKALVYGTVAGQKISFPLPNSDGCSNSGLTCPLKSGQSVQYSSSIYIHKYYPSVKVVVSWSLEDQSKNVIWCVALPVQIR